MTGGNHDGPVVQVALGDARLTRCFVDGHEDEKCRYRNVPVSHGWDNETRIVEGHAAGRTRGWTYLIHCTPAKRIVKFYEGTPARVLRRGIMEGASCH